MRDVADMLRSVCLTYICVVGAQAGGGEALAALGRSLGPSPFILGPYRSLYPVLQIHRGSAT